MNTARKGLLGFALMTGTLAAQNPAFTGVVNAASGIPPGLPNYGIALGSVFTVYGSNLGPSAIQVATLPLPTTAGLAGTSITITVNGTTVTAPMFFTVASQVAAVMPSNTPTGTGTLTLTYNGKSGSTPVTVVRSAFGISNTIVSGDNTLIGITATAVVVFGTNQTQVVSATDAASPGDTLVMYGTGLGPTTAAGDVSGAPFGNIGSAPQVSVGGVPSPSVTYWGRSPGSVGLDQIVFTVPQNVPLGCNVGIVVETTNGTTPVVSNGPTIAVAAKDGATCSDATQLIPYSDSSKSSIKVITMQLYQAINFYNCQTPTTCTTSTSNITRAQFYQLSQAQFVTQAAEFSAQPSFGSCYTGFVSNSGSGAGSNFSVTALNAGPSVTLTPPSGPALTLTSQGGYSYFSAGSMTALPSGMWSFSDGMGGSDVAQLSFSFQVPQQVIWTNQTAVLSNPIDRTKPLTITWSGGDSNGYVDIEANAGTPSGAFGITFECTAPTSAQQFTIPPSILLAMPPGAGAGIGVSTFAIPSSIGSVPGFDVAVDHSEFQTTIPVTFQ